MTTTTETRPDITISSRITDFNVQISAVNIHSHCTQMFGQNYKFMSLYYFSRLLFLKTTYGHSNVCVFVTKPMVELISFQFKFFSFEKHNGIIKQIMTGPSGNRLSICPLRFRIASPRDQSLFV